MRLQEAMTLAKEKCGGFARGTWSPGRIIKFEPPPRESNFMFIDPYWEASINDAAPLGNVIALRYEDIIAEDWGVYQGNPK